MSNPAASMATGRPRSLISGFAPDPAIGLGHRLIVQPGGLLAGRVGGGQRDRLQQSLVRDLRPQSRSRGFDGRPFGRRPSAKLKSERPALGGPEALGVDRAI